MNKAPLEYDPRVVDNIIDEQNGWSDSQPLVRRQTVSADLAREAVPRVRLPLTHEEMSIVRANEAADRNRRGLYNSVSGTPGN